MAMYNLKDTWGMADEGSSWYSALVDHFGFADSLERISHWFDDAFDFWEKLVLGPAQAITQVDHVGYADSVTVVTTDLEDYIP